MNLSIINYIPSGIIHTLNLWPDSADGRVLCAAWKKGIFPPEAWYNPRNIGTVFPEKTENIAAADFFLSGDITAQLAACASEKFVSCYRDVKIVCIQRKSDLIRLNEILVKNQIYAAPEQYDFVVNYIVPRCVNAK